MRITGCEYRLSESEILDWLNQFGEVITEITEESFDDKDAVDDKGESLTPIGNGVYLVTMKLKEGSPELAAYVWKEDLFGI